MKEDTTFRLYIHDFITVHFLVFPNTLIIRALLLNLGVIPDISAFRDKLDASEKALKHMSHLQKIDSTEQMEGK